MDGGYWIEGTDQVHVQTCVTELEAKISLCLFRAHRKSIEHPSRKMLEDARRCWKMLEDVGSVHPVLWALVVDVSCCQWYIQPFEGSSWHSRCIGKMQPRQFFALDVSERSGKGSGQEAEHLSSRHHTSHPWVRLSTLATRQSGIEQVNIDGDIERSQ